MNHRLRAHVVPSTSDAGPAADARARAITDGVNAMIEAIEDYAKDTKTHPGNVAECAVTAAVSLWRDMKAPKAQVQMVLAEIMRDFDAP